MWLSTQHSHTARHTLPGSKAPGAAHGLTCRRVCKQAVGQSQHAGQPLQAYSNVVVAAARQRHCTPLAAMAAPRAAAATAAAAAARASTVPAAAATAAGGGLSGTTAYAEGTGQQHADSAVHRLYAAINARDVAALASCLAADVTYQNLALLDSFTGATAFARFYQDSLGALPPGAEVQLEQQAGQQQQHDGTGSSVAVLWRLVLPSSSTTTTTTTLSRGLALFTLDASGRIASITDCPEHPVKLSARGLSVFGPLLAQGLNLPGAEAVLPAMQELGRAVQQGVDLLLQPLEGVMTPTQADSNAAAGTSTSSGSNGSSTVTSFNSSSNWGTPEPSAVAAAAAAGDNWAAAPAAAAAAAGQPVVAAAAVGSAGSKPAAAGVQRGVAAAAAAVPSRGAPVGDENPGLSGLWVKVPERSDTVGYEAALDVLGLSGLQKVTARLIDGLELQQTSTTFTVSFVTVVPFFKVTEAVPLNGGSSQLGRRDLRWGSMAAAAERVAGGVQVQMSWGQPMAGSLSEKYILLEDGCLSVEALTRVGDRSAASTTIYRRSGGSKEALLADSKKRNPSVAAVLQQQRQQGLDV